MTTTDFNPDKEEQISPMGETFVRAGLCRSCGRAVFAIIGRDGKREEPDPRGFAGSPHSLTTFEEYPRHPFCWECVNEHGNAGYERCRAIAEKWGCFMSREIGSEARP